MPACCLLSRFSYVRLFVTVWTVAFQAPLSVFRVLYSISLWCIYFIRSSLCLLFPTLVLPFPESVSALLYSLVCFIFQIPHVSDNVQYLFVSTLISLSTRCLRSIPVVTDGRSSSFLMAKQYSIVCRNHIRKPTFRSKFSKSLKLYDFTDHGSSAADPHYTYKE